MKKLMAILMTLVMVMTIPAASLAAEMKNSPDVELKVNQQYAFTYTEHKDAEHRTIRSYSKQNEISAAYPHSAVKASTERTKAVLMSLGMTSAFVDELSTEDLEEYSNSPQITSIVTYTKTDAQGKVVNVPEEEAIAVTSLGPNPDQNIIDDGTGNLPSYSTTETDSYMRIVFVVLELGGGRYKYSVDAEWLNMPVWRFRDCIGVAVQNSSVSYGSFRGWYRYTMTQRTLYNTTSQEVRGDFTDSNFAEPTASAWDGGAATFHLPVDEAGDNYQVTNSGFKVHFECEATVNHPQLQTVFNATASYDHCQILFDLSFDVNLLADDGKMACVLGWSINSNTRIAYFDEPFTFNP